MTVASTLRKKRRNLQSDRKARLHQLYSSDDVIKLYEISRNTLTNSIADGLTVIDAEPRLFRGSDLNAFHGRRRKAAGKPLGRFFVSCFGCKRSHSLLEGDIAISPGRTDGISRVSGTCLDTGVRANRFVCSEELEALHRLRDATSRSGSLDSEVAAATCASSSSQSAEGQKSSSKPKVRFWHRRHMRSQLSASTGKLRSCLVSATAR